MITIKDGQIVLPTDLRAEITAYKAAHPDFNLARCALEMSIEKYETLAAAVESGEVDATAGGYVPLLVSAIVSSFCPLCELYLENDDEEECLRCPVSIRTGQTGCDGSPWYEAWRAVYSLLPAKVSFGFREEAAFLASLRTIADGIEDGDGE